MAFTSGKFTVCAAPGCGSTSLTTTRESFDETDRIFVGSQTCDVCGAVMLYSRRPEASEESVMAKKSTQVRGRKKSGKAGRWPGEPKAKKTTREVNLPLRKLGGLASSVVCSHVPSCTDAEDCIKHTMKSAVGKVTHRVTTHKSNGGLPESQEVAPEKVTIGEAMRRAVKELGDIIVDDSLAPAQMRELAEVYEDVAREQAAFNEKSEAAKLAKKSLESVQGLLLEKVRAFTHPTPLPLFDGLRAESDRQDMLEAANTGGAPA